MTSFMPWHRMKEGQEAIYYMAADSKLAAESAPFVEQLVKRDFEVTAYSAPTLFRNPGSRSPSATFVNDNIRKLSISCSPVAYI